jgi:hypothetical protein
MYMFLKKPHNIKIHISSCNFTRFEKIINVEINVIVTILIERASIIEKKILYLNKFFRHY